jgi:hypothetical protein
MSIAISNHTLCQNYEIFDPCAAFPTDQGNRSSPRSGQVIDQISQNDTRPDLFAASAARISKN